MNTSANLTTRRRWKMYHRGMRMAARVRAGKDNLLFIDPDSYVRAALVWAAPFLHRLA